MSRIFVISDPHFGHEKTWKVFKRDDGSPLRPFTSTEEMNETLIRNWNSVVTPEDHVYCLGDVVMNEKFLLPVVSRLMGKKRLVRGNHDLCKTKAYVEAGFKEVYGVRVFRSDDGAGIPDCVLSHVPLHPDCLSRWGVNVHGHLHANIVYKQGTKIPDKRYVNVAVEQINFTPVLLDQIVKERGNADG